MKNLKEVLTAFAKALVPQAEVEEKVEFSIHKVKDTDEELSISVLEVGGIVEVATAEGSAPAASGNYVIEDGTEVVVEDGVITDVVLPENKAEEVTEEVQAEEEATEEVVSEEVKEEEVEEDAPDALAERVALLEDAVTKLIEQLELTASKEDVSAFNSELAEIKHTVKLVSKTPAEFSKVNENPVAKSDATKVANSLFDRLQGMKK